MFTVRKNKPKKGNKFYTRKVSGGFNTCVKGKPTDECDALSNCVGYAEGRINEVISEVLGKDTYKYDTLNCNAESIVERALKYEGVQLLDFPVKGGLMVWSKGKVGVGSDGAGHIEMCEDILEKDEKNKPVKIYDSSSAWGSTAFYNVKRTNSNGRWGLGKGYEFRGCLVFPELASLIPEEPKPVEPPQPTEPEKPKKTEIKVGDTVIVNGVGSADSLGNGAKTKKFKDQKMKVIGISNKKDRHNRYALNQYNRGTAGNWSHVTAWFKEEDLTK